MTMAVPCQLINIAVQLQHHTKEEGYYIYHPHPPSIISIYINQGRFDEFASIACCVQKLTVFWTTEKSNYSPKIGRQNIFDVTLRCDIPLFMT